MFLLGHYKEIYPTTNNLPRIPDKMICMTHAITGKGTVITELTISPAIHAGILVMNKEM